MFFLDKGARPIAWLIRDVWKKRYASTPIPEMRFADIGHRDEAHHDTETPLYQSTPSSEEQVQFEKTFGAKRYSGTVYVIDDKTDTGSSIARAKAMILAANPEATVKSKYIFHKYSFSRMPWSIHRGSTGVIEVGDITTRRITQQRLDEVRKKLWDLFDERSERSLLDAFEYYCRPAYPALQAHFTDKILPIIKLIEDNGGLTSESQTVLQTIKNFELPKLPDSNTDLETKKTFFFSLIKSWNQIWMYQQKIKGIGTFELESLRYPLEDFYGLFADVTEGLHWYNHDGGPYAAPAIATADQYNELDDLEKLRGRERQLRSEIRLLAEEM